MSTLPSKFAENLTSSQHSATLAQVTSVSCMGDCSRASSWCSCFCAGPLKSILKVATRVILLKCQLDDTPLIKISWQFTISPRDKTNIPAVTFKVLHDLALFPFWPHLFTTLLLTPSPPATLVSTLFVDHTRHRPILGLWTCRSSAWNTCLPDIYMAHLLGPFRWHLLSEVTLFQNCKAHPHLHPTRSLPPSASSNIVCMASKHTPCFAYLSCLLFLSLTPTKTCTL